MINKEPFIEVNHLGPACWEGWEAIGHELNRAIASLGKSKVLVAIECFQGTYVDINLGALKKELSPHATCQTRDIYRDEREIRELVGKDLDFKSNAAKISTHSIEDYFDSEKLDAIRSNISDLDEGIVLIHGTGASKVVAADLIIYSDMSRWEILQRFRRNDISNIGVCNQEYHYEHQHYWSYFIDWRICDKIKKQLIGHCHYFMETNNWQKPKLANADVVRAGFEQATRQPIFMAPFFDPELWDQESIQDLKQEDFEWGFNCDIEEDNVLLRISDMLFETPAINLVYYQASKLLGDSIYRKFGSDVPVKLNFMDGTEDGNQLSLDIYPGADHLMDHYGLRYQQVENYYIMDAKRKARMYVNLKEDVDAQSFKQTLDTQKTTEVTALFNSINLEKHDHLAIPQETIHSNGHQAIILHISTAPQIFKSVLYKDKVPENILPARIEELIAEATHKDRKKVVKNNLKAVNGPMHEELLAPDENSQICISRIWFEKELELETHGIFHIFNLIEGHEIIIEGIDNEFKPFTVHYAETFFIPAGVSEYVIRSASNSRVGLLRVRPNV